MTKALYIPRVLFASRVYEPNVIQTGRLEPMNNTLLNITASAAVGFTQVGFEIEDLEVKESRPFAGYQWSEQEADGSCIVWGCLRCGGTLSLTWWKALSRSCCISRLR